LKSRGVARSLFCIALLLLLSGRAWAVIDVTVTSPWLTLMARFIGGIQVRVHPLSGWDAGGGIIRYGKASRRYPAIALDETEARAYGISGRSVKTLFEAVPGGLPVQASSFLDPSSLAFIGQRLLGALSAIDPGNYAYYQRRLAEFQSRTDTTVSVGRKLLEGLVLLDLTGASGKWVRAAVEAPIRPPDRVMALWKNGKSLETLSVALQDASKNGWVVVVDPWTPQAVRERTKGIPRVASIPAPVLEKEMLSILNDLYLAIWNASGKRITPQKP
jgi:hypothetical protein